MKRQNRPAMAHRRRCAAMIAALLAAIACASCAHQGPQSGFVTIVITGDNGSRSYSPASITVTQGTFVTWINQDSQPHTATAPGAFDSGVIAPNGGRWTWPAAVIGSFSYHSLIQPDMTGSITVVSAPISY